MKQVFLRVDENIRIADRTYRMRLSGDVSAFTAPGQFLNLKLDGFTLRRPISVYDKDGESVTIVYKTVGEGTLAMSRIQPGAVLDVLTGLGNGYDTGKSGDTPLLIGGGVGVPPLYLLCRCLVAQGKHPTVILGFNSAAEVFGEEEFRALGVPVKLATADGSRGVRGFVTDCMRDVSYSYFYACGPMPMFRAIEQIAVGSGQYSFEERMGCGFGACMGCTCRTLTGGKRICVDGPVLEREEILWQTQA